MLYDPKWQKTETSADPFNLNNLILWLEAQPPEDKYCYFDNGGCLLAKYFTAIGRPVNGVGGTTVLFVGGERNKLPRDFANIASGIYSEKLAEEFTDQARTFGAALSRARKLAA